MRNTVFALLVPLLAAPACSAAVEHLIPAGTVFQCTISEPKLSSKTEDLGDPILCDVRYSGYSWELGHSQLPYDTHVVGHFEEYKDPGHFVGKGWMELKFERMVIEPNTVIPIHAKVVGVHGYNVDRQGRILGKGHAVRDTVEWMIPILWPIDLLNLPRRGPRPTLKAETQLSLKVMDDFGVPTILGPQEVSPGLYRREPSSYSPPVLSAPPPAPLPPYWLDAGLPQGLQGPWGTAVSNTQHTRPPYTGPGAMQPMTLIFNDGRPPEQAYNYMVTPSMLYVLDGERQAVPLRELDLDATNYVNRKVGIYLHMPTAMAEQATEQ
jgi:hypothetical protein